MATYAFSDLHGQYNLWDQIKNYIKPTDTVFCLGDCIDRGYCGLDILFEIFKFHNITLLKGNHEDLLEQIGYEIYKNTVDDWWWQPSLYEYVDLWYANGGKKSYKHFLSLSKTKQIKLINKIKKLPTHIEYINKKDQKIYLCHAGRASKAREEITRHPFDLIATNNFIWDRSHIYKDSEKKWQNNEYCIHGHTPTHYMHYFDITFKTKEKEGEILRYCGDHKIDIDLGSFETHRACLLDLDTFEPIYFKEG